MASADIEKEKGTGSVLTWCAISTVPTGLSELFWEICGFGTDSALLHPFPSRCSPEPSATQATTTGRLSIYG
jgi:hypothetical protein